MQIKQLEYLLKIVECGSITKAAQQLFISQPSLTKSIMLLEQEYGIQLLVRKPRGVELTTEGNDFLYYARNILAAANALTSNFSQDASLGKSRLFLASQQLDFVYDLMLKIYEENEDKQIHYNLVETDRNDVTQLVLKGDVDLGLFVRSKTDAKTFLWHTEAKRLNMYVLDCAGVYACVGPKSPYYNRETITFSEAEKCLQVVLDMESQAKQNLYFDNPLNHFNSDRIIFFNSVNGCEHFLLSTDALLFVSKWALGCFNNQIIHKLRIINDDASCPECFNELLWIKRAGEPLNLTETKFIYHLYQYFKKPLPQFLR